MKLIRIETTNFKKLECFAADFTDGLNVIVGGNFQGKSTLLQAVSVAMFGVSAAPDKKERLVTRGRKGMSITLDFEHEGQRYRIVRDLKNSKILNSEGGEVAVGNTPCTKFITELFKLSLKDYNLFVQSAQHETAAILTFGATELQRRVETFSGAELIDSILKLARSKLSKLETELDLTPPVDLEQAAAAAESSTKQRAVCEAALQVHGTQLALAEESCDQAVSRFKALSSDFEKQVSLTNRLHILKTEAAGVADKLTHLQQLLGDPVDLEPLQDQAAHAKQAHAEATIKRSDAEQLSKSIRQLEAAKQEAQSALERELEFSKLKAQLDDKLESTATELAEVAASLKAKLAAKKELQDHLSEGVCSACKRPFDGHDTSTAEKSLATAVSECEATSTIKSNLEALKGQLVAELKNVPRFTTGNEDRLAKICSDLQSQVKTAEGAPPPPGKAELDTLYETLIEASAAVESAHKHNKKIADAANDIANLDHRAAELQSVIQKTEAALALAAPISQEDVNRLQEDAEKATETLRTLKADERVIRIELGQAVTAEKAAADALQHEEEMKLLMGKLAFSIDQHKRLIKFLSDSRTTYLSRVWEQIVNTASHYVTVASRGAITKIDRSDTGEFMFEEDGYWMHTSGSSGAQKGYLGVALRVALSKVLYGSTGLLILDEPTESMNDEHAQQLCGSLMGLGGQLLLVTHRNLERLSAQNVIEIGGGSNVA